MTQINLKYDGSLNIAVGKSRKETSWKNRDTLWSTFVNRVSETHRTPETYGEYMNSKKSLQDERKDVGGFVGGYIINGRRKTGGILHRQMVTLDIDFGSKGIWEDYQLLYGNAAAIYSTHKHSPSSPRLRLILPLDREVTVDEYVAISRRIAGNLGINYFDDTTFEPTRLMYWPSSSKDAEYFFAYEDGPWLSADAILATYRNWQDASEWPFSDRVGETVHREMKKQEDPTEKPGIVGAFCRVYDIHAAIDKFLPDKYEPCDIEDRYTYVGGSTSAGLVVYADKFAFSHHGTDPCSGKLVNAFDLVRLHLHGLKDEDSKEGTPSNRMPSYVAMMEMATKDPETRRQIGSEKIAQLKSEFTEMVNSEMDPDDYAPGEYALLDDNGKPIPESEYQGHPTPAPASLEPEEPVNDDWLTALDVDGKGNIRSTIENAVLILQNDPLLKGKLALNTFSHREVLRGSAPWRKVRGIEDMIDRDDAGLRYYLEKAYDIASAPKISDALAYVVEKNAFHPVKDYLESLVWDGTMRCDRLFVDYLGVADTPYARAVTRKVLAAAVNRIFVPGCKFDYVPVLVGNQGCGKSTLVKKLGKAWFSDSFTTVIGKEAYEQLQGKWILEMAELNGLKKAEINAVKHFISKQEDSFRVAYGKRTENFPRQSVFIGTINEPDFLQDPTGNRRFWPLDTGEKGTAAKSVFDDLPGREVDQIWAEAVCLFKAGEPLFLSQDIEDEAAAQQTSHSEVDDRAGLIREYLNTPITEDWITKEPYARRNFYVDEAQRDKGTEPRNRVSVAEIWREVFGKDAADMNKFNTKSIHNIMRSFPDWEYAKAPTRVNFYGVQRCYHRSINLDFCMHEGEKSSVHAYTKKNQASAKDDFGI